MCRHPLAGVIGAAVCAALFQFAFVPSAHAQFDQLAAKIPDAANVAALIDAERLLESPLAKNDGWKEKYEQQFAAGLVAIAPDTRRMILSAQYDFDYMKPQWKMAIADFRNERALATLARQTKGTLDPVGDTQALVLRDDAYCVQFSPTRLAVMAPANRQSVARWLRESAARTAPALSPYLKGTLIASQTHQVVIAFDLEDAVPMDVIKGKLGTSSAVSGKNINVDPAAKALAGIRGAVLEVAVTDSATGKLMVHFSGDASALAPIAKPLLMEVLGDIGARIDDIESWNVATEPQRFAFSGPLSKDGRKRVFSLIDTPTSALIATDPSAESSTRSQSAGQAQATLKYFTTVTSMRDDLRSKNNDAKTFGQFAMWLDNDARRIDRLPILDVDPSMLAYGRYLSARMRDASMALKGIGIQSAAKSYQIYQTVTTDYNAYGGVWGGGYSQYTEWRNVDAERRAVKAQERATGATTARGIAQEVENETVKIRQEMTAKYRVNF
jgi:hypothetical protein